ncbi:RNA polymerase sigma24 factor [Gordonia sp. KTR9]|uniref:RNA polymerase sigma24 factor n=1 Tax=Gordonia sp. KTR9 TaxID=337191 RepID=UPI00027DE24A|nr:RNA polymerase sigma24 factor [Gordonia sp. KTR9]AFR49632.1 DNA-directed RNA polymerase specialized sigma subunit, sigma24-like protein [Gordonia sp. KTR9]
MSGTDAERRVARPDPLRPLLFTVAYEILGSATTADAIVDRDLRCEPAVSTPRDDRRSRIGAVARQSLDALQSRQSAEGQYVGPWLPEPIRLDGDDLTGDPILAESIATATLVLLESLAPVDRTVHVLGDVFGVGAAEIGTILSRPAGEIQQAALRARSHVEAHRPAFEPVDSARTVEFVDEFLAIAESGDLGTLMTVLAPEVVFTADSDGKVVAVRQPVHGARDVARAMSGFARIGGVFEDYRAEASVFNSQPGIAVYYDGRLQTVLTLRLAGGLVDHVYVMRNPDKLVGVERLRSVAR